MNTQEALEKAEAILKDLALSFTCPEENRLDAVIKADDLKKAVEALLVTNRWGYLSALTGLDNPEYEVDEDTREKVAVEGKGSLEVLYHFAAGAAITTLRVSLPYDTAEIDSICDLVPAATLYEREAMELFGICFKGTPSTEHLVLPDCWPNGVYPLRKTFKGLNEKAQG
ncbi:MAG TPA: NADH-quinone oxidoreductase subunit C [Anaerolineaceae bacterium]|nr:NADH-quinone oxidoreductase subunit C [Anaerolineaceae bacterium]HUM62085.1 NADH-quinone oxidoreductase subunit C [Anaerolineaceae bacterium]